LLGTTLLFWGAMTGRPLVGLLCALFVEGHHWIKLRWNFNDSSYESAWQLSFVLMILTSVVIWLDESRYTAVLVMMGWLPPILMPLQFVQSYGMRDSVQLTAFSLLARRSRLRSERLGLIHQSVAFNFGNVTFIITLLSAAVAMKVESQLFLPGLVLLCGWMLISTGRCRWRSLAPVLIVAGFLGLAGQHGLERLEKWVRRGGSGHDERFNPNFQSTQIGQSGRVLQSPEVMWRLTTKPGESPPYLLRTSTFSNFLGLSWQNQRFPFAEVDTVFVDTKRHFIIDPNTPADDIPKLPDFRLRGSVDKTFAMPLPGSAVSIEGLGDATVEKNVLGTVQVKPEASVVDVGVWWSGNGTADGETRNADLSIAPLDREVIREVSGELGLSKLPDLKSKLARIDQWFQEEFRYTLDLTIIQPTAIARTGQKRPSALRQFLTEVRAGHCEYFATSATLILRSIGVHARYAVGFGVMESSGEPNEYLIRGTHAHAWVRVWDEENQTWIDFDPTPSDWMGNSTTRMGWLQRVKDWIKQAREDFFLWRTNPDNELMVVSVVSLFGVALALVVIRRLWRSRSRIDERSKIKAYEGNREETPLHELESLVRRCIGPRPAGMTYACWLRVLHGQGGLLRGLDEAIMLHQQWRFDPQPVEEPKQARLRELVEELEQALRQRISEQQKT